MLRQAQHWTDAPVAGRQRRRAIRNWSNYREPGSPWRETRPAVEESVGPPDNWAGDFDFRLQSTRSPLQSFLGDTSDPDNAAMAGCRLADDPGVWVNLKAVDVSPGWLFTEMSGARAVEWPGIWPNTTLRYEVAAHKLIKTLILEKPGHPLVFQFTLRIADGMSVKFAHNGAQILDADGVERMRLVAPWGRDSSTVHLDTMEGQKPIGVTLREGESRTIDGREYQVVELVVSEEDLERAVYPVTIDPTVQITGTTDIEDTVLQHPTHDNWGGYIYFSVGSGDLWRGLVRIANIGAIPEGTITAFKLFVWAAAFSNLPQTLAAFVVSNANNWIEGTAVSAIQPGSCDWFCTVHDTVTWAGDVGCGTPDVDYDDDPSPPELTIGSGDTWYGFILDEAWPPLWRDAVRNSNGIKVVQKVPVSGQMYMHSSEHSSNPLYFEIDYIAGSAIAAMSLPRRIHG